MYMEIQFLKEYGNSLSNSVYPTSRRQRPSGRAGGAVACLSVPFIDFSSASTSALAAAASLTAVATELEPSVIVHEITKSKENRHVGISILYCNIQNMKHN